jgi:molybdopterin/thiamine biosynthesis adenylyltransferase
MTALGISLLERHIHQLRQHLFSDDGNEHAAYVLFGAASIGATNWGSPSAQLFVSHATECVSPEAILASSPSKISWQTSDVIQKLKIAQDRKLTLGIVHNHAVGNCIFSHVDDANESELIRTIQNRNGPSSHLVSLLITPDGKWSARLWLSPKDFIDASEFRTVGERFTFEVRNGEAEALPAFLDRQTLALGKAFNQQLRRLRIAIVGCGGTGSAVAALLARMGVGALALIDSDTVDETNLNRLHGARRADAITHQPKVDIVARAIAEIGLGTCVVTHKGWVSDPACRDILKSAHIVFGCTDDNAGRILLNRFAYAYQIPVIDMGLAIQLSRSNPPIIQAMDGRVTVLLPGEGCLLCRGVIDPRRAAEESLKRQNPTEFERRKSESYVLGEQDPSPAVVTFTTELACMAINEMIHRLQGYRGELGATASRTRLFHRMTDLRPHREPDPDCRVCGQPINWCRGDTEPFLGIVA